MLVSISANLAKIKQTMLSLIPDGSQNIEFNQSTKAWFTFAMVATIMDYELRCLCLHYIRKDVVSSPYNVPLNCLTKLYMYFNSQKMPVSTVSKWPFPGQQSKSITTQGILHQHSSKMSAAEVALIVICSLVFVGGVAILAIFLAKFKRFLIYSVI